jgi:hypothetical protein
MAVLMNRRMLTERRAMLSTTDAAVLSAMSNTKKRGLKIGMSTGFRLSTITD